jgi:hypothetical protein
MRALKVGPHHVTIMYVDQKTLNGVGDDERLVGFTDLITYTVYVLDSLKGSLLVDALLHEVLHVIMYNTGCPVGNEEKVVSATATGLTALFADNPELHNWIQLTLSSGNRESV